MARIPNRPTSTALASVPEAAMAAMPPNQRWNRSASPRPAKICWIEEIIPKSIPNPSVCTRIDSRVVRWPKTSPVAARSERAPIGLRAATGSVSGWRSISQPRAMAAKRTKARNTPRQPASCMIPQPSVGAMAGTRVKISMTKLMIRAIARPS